ncbi:unnamed protein product [Cylindrotheca closterium]|uniref:Uncharacterized protein n=1 Tax=Cylindrotheca closterium TaxID=2856 RepID=A0AAD2PUH6_9STRA|nr:unnamed protein product [Cylindrotheca closterium]
MNYASRGKHDPQAEQNNQHLKALFRVHFHQMPFKAIPKKLTVALMTQVAKISNYYQAKGGLSAYYSPHMIMHQRMVDATKEFVVEIGAYVHGYGHDTTNNMAARTIEGVYMGPTNDIQEGHCIYDLNKKCEAQCTKIKVLPMTDQVIKIIEEDARLEGVTELRTYSKHNGELILNGDLLKGVDPDELWDENYVPVNKIERLSDVTLRNENIPDDELDELLMDAEADKMEARLDRDRNPRYDSKASQYEDELEDEMFNRMFKQIKARQDAEDQLDKDYQEHEWITGNEDIDYEDNYESELDDDEAKQMLDKLAAELVEPGKPDKEEVLFTFDEEDEDDDNTQEGVVVESEEEDSVAHTGVRFADGNESKGIVRSYIDDGVEIGTKRVLCPRHNRSYFLQGVKMRPSERYQTEKSRFGQAYLQRKNPPVPNVLRNRHAMRRKAQMKRLRVLLYQAIKRRIDTQRKGAQLQGNHKYKRSIQEHMHNLAFQQVGNTNKGKYDADKALVVARVIQQIRDGVNGGINGQDGVLFIQQYYLNKRLKIFKERGKDAAMKELDQLIKRSSWTPISIEKLKPRRP